MTRVFIASAKPEERTALRHMLQQLDLQVVGEASDWFSTLAKAPATNFNILLVDWDMLPMNAATGLSELRQTCTYAIVVVLTSKLDTLKQAALAAGADAFISKGEIPDRLAERLRSVAETLSVSESTHSR
jgi:DNA-binding NarL/FixJ family response regulator